MRYFELGSVAFCTAANDRFVPRLTLNMAFPTRTLLPAKTRLFMEMLVRRFQTEGFEQRWTANWGER